MCSADTNLHQVLRYSESDVIVEREPYPHFVVGNALSDIDLIDRDFPSEDLFGDGFRSHGDLTYPDDNYLKLLDKHQHFRLLHDFVYSKKFISFFLSFFEDDIRSSVKNGELLWDPLSLPIKPIPFEVRGSRTGFLARDSSPFLYPRLDIGYGKVGYGAVNGGRGVHIDNLERIVSVLIYIGSPVAMQGGEHRLYKLEGKTPVVQKVVPPESNLCIASIQSNRAYHDVNPVTSIIGVRKSIYMAVSCSKPIWAPENDPDLMELSKNRAASVQMPKKTRTRARNKNSEARVFFKRALKMLNGK